MRRERPPASESEPALAGLCVALGAREVAGWSAAEQALAAAAVAPAPAVVAATRAAIGEGRDPLGEAFGALRSTARRRALGATYTPAAIVHAMVAWAHGVIAAPDRIVDPGTGSGRFLLAAARQFRAARLVGIELDPLAALTARANLAAHDLGPRAEVHVVDYRLASLAGDPGRTLFLGNPPYVRHHELGAEWKTWLSRTARAHGLRASQLAGLHVHFFLATLGHARRDDVGTFVTAAEWLDVNYGQLVRDLLAGPLGVVRLDLLEPVARAFGEVMTTSVITGFRVGAAAATVEVARRASVAELGGLTGGQARTRASLAAEPRWSALSRVRRAPAPDLVELGELCRVHRGQVTGANATWVVGDETPPLPPRFLRPAITGARELFEAGEELVAADHLRRAIDLPADLDGLPAAERELVERFLAWARARRADASYVARHRTPWWAVRLREPAPILATYMARRPPAFVRNRVGARHINIAHGLYPRAPISARGLDLLAEHLRRHASLTDGRVYAGGLTKFEPGEMARLLVPTLVVLEQRAADPRAA